MINRVSCNFAMYVEVFVVKWVIYLSLDPRVEGSNSSLELTSYGKTLVHIFHSPSRFKWVHGAIRIAGPFRRRRNAGEASLIIFPVNERGKII